MKSHLNILLILLLSFPATAWNPFDSDINDPLLIDPNIERPTPEMIAIQKLEQAKKDKAAAELEIKKEQAAILKMKADKLAEEKAETKRLADVAETKRLADVAEAKRLADVAAEIKRNASIYTIAEGQTYLSAIKTWFSPLMESDKNKEGVMYKGIMWELPPATIETLENEVAVKDFVFNKKLAVAITEIGKTAGVDMTLTLDSDLKLGALSDEHLNIYWISGDSLREVVENLSIDFGWEWLDEDSLHSWLSHDDFNFNYPYPIAVKKDSFEEALNTVLTGYPLQAKLLYGTRTVFITSK